MLFSLLAFLSFPLPGVAASLCPAILNHQELSYEVAKLVDPDAYKQWRLWQQQANLEEFRKSSQLVSIQLSAIPASEIDLRTVSDVPQELVKKFTANSTSVWWPKHPHNEDPRVPHFRAANQGQLQGW